MNQLENPRQIYPMFIASDLKKTREFYVRAGFTIRFDMPEYLHVSYQNDPKLEFAFMVPHQATNGRKYESYAGQGVVISIPTRNADEKSRELVEKGIEPINPIEDKPWGWRSFHVEDPNGVVLDFFHVSAQGPKPDVPPAS